MSSEESSHDRRWEELRRRLWGLARVLAPYSTGTFRAFPQASNGALTSLELTTMEFPEHLLAIGDEFVHLASERSEIPKRDMRLALFVFTALLTIPEPVSGREQAIELAWRWHDKLDEALGRFSIVG